MKFLTKKCIKRLDNIASDAILINSGEKLQHICRNSEIITFKVIYLGPRSRSLIVSKDNRFIHLHSKFHEDIYNQSKVIKIWNFWAKTFIFDVFDQKMHKMTLKCHKRCHFNQFWWKTARYLQKWWNKHFQGHLPWPKVKVTHCF